MSEILIKDYSGGWMPGEDPIQGRKNGLLKMNNVELDSNGALTLCGGTVVKQTGFPSNAHTIGSRLINGARHDYSLLADGSIYRDITSIATGGDSTNGAIGTAFNFTLLVSGDKRIKDNGSAVVNLGVLPPTAFTQPTVNSTNFPYAFIGDVGANYVAITGTATNPTLGGNVYLQLTTDANGFAVVQTYAGTGAPYNANLLTGVGGAGNIGYATDADFIVIQGYTPYPWGVTLEFDVLLQAGNVTGDQVSDFYAIKLELVDQEFDPYTGVFTIRTRRDAFTRFGSKALDWSTVYGFRLTVVSTNIPTTINFLGSYFGNTMIQMAGGSRAQFGVYQYLQVNVNDTGSYQAKSIAGPLSNPITINGNQALLIPQDTADTQVNQAWIYRRGGLLEKWYRVKVFTMVAGAYGGVATQDILGDQDALTLKLILNLNLVSIASTTITDKIFDIVGPVNGRWYYFTTNFMYPSDINDPDLVDASIAVRITGSSSELLMWARQVTDSTILVGTSLDVYTLSGTFATFPDFTIDIYFRPLHCEYPPLTCDAVVWGSQVYYLANDGWRIIDGSGGNPSLVSPNLDRLYRGETVEGYTGANLKVLPRSVRFPIVIAKNKMWCFVTGVGTLRIEVYDFIRQYWRPVVYSLGEVSAACRTQDGQVLAFYTDKKLREVDVQSSKLIDGATKQSVLIKSMVFDGGAPRCRKDSSTVKLRALNADAINISIIVDGSLTINSAGNSTVSSTFVKDQFFDISAVANLALVKTYQVILGTDSTIANLIVDDISILYDQRPEQRSFLRIQSNNYGTSARKRIATIPFQLDSLGNDVTVIPYLDGVAQPTGTYNSSRKTSFNYEFLIEGGDLARALDYEYVIHSAGLFEFFGFGEPRIVETYQQQTRGFVIPVSNFGNAQKKRLRVWPFVISSPTIANSVTYTPIVDGSTTLPTVFIVGQEKITYRHFFKTDIFGVDYGGYFSSTVDFEVDQILPPEIVETLPIAKQFDQLGPEEFFRYGKVKQIEIRVLPYGESIPYTIYFNDTSSKTGTFTVVYGKEDSYYLMMPKNVAGHVIRIELGPTSFDFHRFYMRVQVAKSGKDTDLEWINL